MIDGLADEAYRAVAEGHLNTARVSAGVPVLTVIAHSGVDRHRTGSEDAPDRQLLVLTVGSVNKTRVAVYRTSLCVQIPRSLTEQNRVASAVGDLCEPYARFSPENSVGHGTALNSGWESAPLTASSCSRTDQPAPTVPSIARIVSDVVGQRRRYVLITHVAELVAAVVDFRPRVGWTAERPQRRLKQCDTIDRTACRDRIGQAKSSGRQLIVQGGLFYER